LRFKLPTTGCRVPPDCEKSYRKIAVAFTPQAGTAFSGSGGAGKPAPLHSLKLCNKNTAAVSGSYTGPADG